MTDSNSIATRLRALDTPTLSDALDKLGLPGAVFGIGPLTVVQPVIGRAITVKLGAPLAGLPKRHLGAGAIMAAREGDVIVVEGGVERRPAMPARSEGDLLGGDVRIGASIVIGGEQGVEIDEILRGGEATGLSGRREAGIVGHAEHRRRNERRSSTPEPTSAARRRTSIWSLMCP